MSKRRDLDCFNDNLMESKKISRMGSYPRQPKLYGWAPQPLLLRSRRMSELRKIDSFEQCP